MAWSATDIPDQRGRVAVITGANSGIGFHTALELARAGARVVLGVRDLGKGADAEGRIRGQVPSAQTEVRRLDLGDLGVVRTFATEVSDAYDGLDLLVNNAGVMALPRRTTADGFEGQFGTNHLGHFALTGLLLGRLTARPDSRVVTVSSTAHRMGRMNFDDLQGERRYFRWTAYGQSKLANLLFAFELQPRAAAAGLPLRSLAAHPGYAATNLQFQAAQLTGSKANAVVNQVLNRLFAQSDAMGALPTLYAATVPDLPGGTFVGPDGRFESQGHPTVVTANARARDEASARRLWEVSETLTGVRFAFGGARALA